ncbi:MAG TPA: bifunctional molybdenum cofactor biosynthesis protein MoaC/MoaB [Oligoflexus sp.]|uniref:bifunctional molybdenum cofactor biosynthesis protein MoaC/MoaB n=1 Tax=Oligoflexus sp. TaxID=1971216 RepID=UPI002D42AC5A|nr:bifunctional molybdenum cofactor biosynthesis protein MoaC/MoaB [Oligoflexus sp.]HYX36069.1 bifunctional molybdenum cofactor biosynthesis protein MoaC/MoaB [Oligoflexus sp.]
MEATSGSNFRMIDVSPKAVTHRRSLAEGRIYLSPLVFEKVKSRTLPKGDALVLAEVAGIMAAKNTALLLPLCHPLPIEAVFVTCELEPDEQAVRVRCEVTTSAKTGVEMEALVGVQAALLCIYDLSKGTDPVIRIGDVTLLEKEGGKSGFWQHPLHAKRVMKERQKTPEPHLNNIRVTIVTISDSCYEGSADDTSGSWLVERCEASGAMISKQYLVPDEVDSIRQVVMEAVETHRSDLILTTGGTGLSPRDITPEALKGIWDREIPGFGELLRSSGARHTPLAFLSRSGAGTIGSSLVITLPGSLKAVKEGLEALLPLLPHAFHVTRGGRHDNPS